MYDDDLVERVAEAIRLRSIQRGHPIYPVVMRHLARAAIAAIEAAGYVVVPREPTEKMMEIHDDYPFMPEAWRAMIDAIEKDKERASMERVTAEIDAEVAAVLQERIAAADFRFVPRKQKK